MAPMCVLWDVLDLADLGDGLIYLPKTSMELTSSTYTKNQLTEAQQGPTYCPERIPETQRHNSMTQIHKVQQRVTMNLPTATR